MMSVQFLLLNLLLVGVSCNCNVHIINKKMFDSTIATSYLQRRGHSPVGSAILCYYLLQSTRICRSISDLHNVTELQSDIDKVTKWSSRNDMALHEDKFEYMIYHLANKRNPLYELPFVREYTQHQLVLYSLLWISSVILV